MIEIVEGHLYECKSGDRLMVLSYDKDKDVVKYSGRWGIFTTKLKLFIKKLKKYKV